MKSEVYQWYLDDYWDSMMSTSGSWMNIRIFEYPLTSLVKSNVNQLHLDDNR